MARRTKYQIPVVRPEEIAEAARNLSAAVDRVMAEHTPEEQTHLVLGMFLDLTEIMDPNARGQFYPNFTVGAIYYIESQRRQTKQTLKRKSCVLDYQI